MAADQKLTNRGASIAFGGKLFEKLQAHLFPGDDDEHGAVIAAGVTQDTDGSLRLFARDLFLARDGVDYVSGIYGYKMLRAEFIYERIRYCREQRLAYLAVHNHGGMYEVDFSTDDLQSHQRGYPALIDVIQGLPVGALVFARKAIAGDIWLPDGTRCALDHGRVFGDQLMRLYPRRASTGSGRSEMHDRQILLFGSAGQQRLQKAKVGVIGLGGVGSLLVEYLSRLGIGSFVIADQDQLQASNFSRVVGSTTLDLPQSVTTDQGGLAIGLRKGKQKTEIASRLIFQSNPKAKVEALFGNFATESIAQEFVRCDFLFLAADSMQARLVFNAIAHQYLIPGIQIGTKIVVDPKSGTIEEAFTAVRWVLPDIGCLWCNGLISRHGLAWEAKTTTEQREQQYGAESPNPSVITMNAVGAAHAVNDFLLYFQGLSSITPQSAFLHFNHLRRTRSTDEPRADPMCPECGTTMSSRLGRGDNMRLPTV